MNKLREQMYSMCIESEDRQMVCHYEVTDEILDKFITLILDEVLDIGEDILCSYPANMTKRGDATKDYMEAIDNLRGE